MRLFRRDSGPDQTELIDQQQRGGIHKENIRQGQNGPMGPQETRRHLRELTDHDLDENTIRLMSNMFSKDFMLSNLTDAEVKEIKWIARSIARKIKRMHPHPNAAAQGEYRKLVFNDPNDGLKPLSSYQENLVDQATLDFLTRPPRSRGGWQQDELGKQINVSKVEDDDDGREKGSLFSR